MNEKQIQEIKTKLIHLSLLLRKVTEGWNVTHETPKETRQWVAKLDSVATKTAIGLEKIVEDLK